MKMILKEIIITLLICIAILLVLAIVFYDYNPLNKVVPNQVAYSTPNEIKKEISDTEVENILDYSYNVVYSIENADLQKYKNSERYVPGKEHPFTGIEPATGDTIYGQSSPTLATGGAALGPGEDLDNVNATSGGSTGSGATSSTAKPTPVKTK